MERATVHVAPATMSLSALLRRVGAAEFSVVAAADHLNAVISGVRIVTGEGEEPIGSGELILLDGPRDACWTLAPRAVRAGAAGVVIARDWPGAAPAMLAAFAERLRLPVLAWNAETTWSGLRARVLDALELEPPAAEPGRRGWRPSTLLDLLEGRSNGLSGDFELERGGCVMAFSATHTTKNPETDDAIDRALWLSLLDPDVPSDAEGVRIGGTAYLVIRALRTERELRAIAEHVRCVLSMSLDRSVVAAIGPTIDSASDLAASRAEADRVLILARRRPTPGTVTLADVQHLALLEQAAAVLSTQPHLFSQKLAVLRRSDAARNTSYVAVLRSFLDHFGDVNASAQGLGMHHNTFRYRLRRGVEIAGINLDDPSERLALQVELALEQ
jgi:hypothetical protein